FAPMYSAVRCSNSLVRGPVVTQPDLNACTTSSISSSPISGREKGRNSLLMGGASSISLGLAMVNLQHDTCSNQAEPTPLTPASNGHRPLPPTPLPHGGSDASRPAAWGEGEAVAANPTVPFSPCGRRVRHPQDAAG